MAPRVKGWGWGLRQTSQRLLLQVSAFRKNGLVTQANKGAGEGYKKQSRSKTQELIKKKERQREHTGHFRHTIRRGKQWEKIGDVWIFIPREPGSYWRSGVTIPNTHFKNTIMTTHCWKNEPKEEKLSVGSCGHHPRGKRVGKKRWIWRSRGDGMRLVSNESWIMRTRRQMRVTSSGWQWGHTLG